jgi:hypothetical protein
MSTDVSEELVASIFRVENQPSHLLHLHLQHRQHTIHEEETSDNRRKTKKPPLHTARITTTLIDWQATKIGGPPKNHHEDIF